ncbi:ABC transporter permease [Metasolibacillus meyeri]|uniref:Transport permease protein n=1 Tax=Metasolibacillus meyeri TaxID=1071052 RepID=A0AAW9NIY6_9BACL|nr:ABC transporter permease [Metasolibacillus meyeri]MEC1178639.1 ABC transporter permease [Metasolibacillus meyeri]
MHFISLLSLNLRFFTDLKNKFYIYLFIFQPAIMLFIITTMLKIRSSYNADKYIIAVGISVAIIYVVYSSGSSIVSEKWWGTIELLLGSNTSLFKIILSKTVSNAIIATMFFFISIAYAKFLFGYTLEIKSYLLFALSFLVLIISFIAIGSIIGLLSLVFKDVFTFHNILHLPLVILSGIFFPVDSFMLIIKFLSFCLPSYWSVSALFNSIGNVDIYPFIFKILLSLTLTILYLLITLFLTKKLENNILDNSKVGL